MGSNCHHISMRCVLAAIVLHAWTHCNVSGMHVAPVEDRAVRFYLGLGRQEDNTKMAAQGFSTGALLCCGAATVADGGDASSPLDAKAVLSETNALRSVFRDTFPSHVAAGTCGTWFLSVKLQS